MRTIFDSESENPEGWETRIAAITADAVANADAGLIERCIGSLLRVVREQLDLEVLFVGEFVNANRVFRHIDSKTAPAIVQPGQFHPLDETICQRIIDGRMDCLVPDITRVRIANGLPDYYDGMGAHIGVPVRFTDGTLYGVLCGFSFEPGADLEERDVKRLEMAADAIAQLLAQAEGHEVRLSHTR
ncbi:GAF domain-containing protein [Variovorax sp. LjRoot290]|uniref:GAF domain-containing protein n=1 Tax=unclassified Variovorax TaxID=663243 RepID=UPI003ECCE6E2